MLNDALTRMKDVFAPSALVNGLHGQKKGNVLNIRLSDGLLKARIKSGKGQIYDVFMDLKQWPRIPAHCTCQTRLNCEHAASALFAMQEKEKPDIRLDDDNKKNIPIAQWMDKVEQSAPAQPAVKSKTHAIIYLLERVETESGMRLYLSLALAKRQKRKDFGQILPFNQMTEYRSQFLDSADEEIIRRLPEIDGWFDRFALRDSVLLEAILKTQRACFKEDEDTLLTQGKTRQAMLVWKMDVHGRQHPMLTVDNKPVDWLLLDAPWMFAGNCLSRLEMSVPMLAFKKIINFPAVSLNEVDHVAEAIQALDISLPLPSRYTERTRRKSRPVKIIRFDTCKTPPQAETMEMLYVCRLAFKYHEHELAMASETDPVYSVESGHLYVDYRDKAFETEALEQLNYHLALRQPDMRQKLLYEAQLNDCFVLPSIKDEHDIQTLMKDIAPALSESGWQVEWLSSSYEEDIEEGDVEWFSEYQDSGNQFFAYQEGVKIDGQIVNLVPLVADLLAKYSENEIESFAADKRIKMSLGHGKALRLQFSRIKPLLLFLLQYGTKVINKDNELLLNRYQLLLLEEKRLAGLAVAERWKAVESLRRPLQQLMALDGLKECPSPKGLKAQLRDYQAQGLMWLQLLRTNQLGGVLADDMGLGKTIQTLAHLLTEKEQGRLNQASLILVPTSLVMNWYEEAQRFAPDLKVLVHHGNDRHEAHFDKYDLVISTYGVAQRDKSRFVDYEFYYLILDEAQWIKNAKSKTTQIILQIKSQYRLCLSGTPLENHLGELWSLFHFLMPGLLGDSRQFKRFFRTPIEKDNNLKRQQLLASRVKPFLLRRTKNQVARELPEKTEMIYPVEMESGQREVYEMVRMSMESKVREAIGRIGLGKSRIILLDALLKLRQVCCDPRLLSHEAASQANGESAKLDALMELLDNLIDEGRRVLVFSQFTSMLELIEAQIKKRHYTYLKLTGQTKNRQHLVNDFQKGNTPVFLISLKAGGTGLNLTKADTVIQYDPWWNPAAEDQAADRSHRIGQKNPVFVYKMVCKGSVEETIVQMQARKRALFSGILGDSEGKSGLFNEEDLNRLFMPMVEV